MRAGTALDCVVGELPNSYSGQYEKAASQSVDPTSWRLGLRSASRLEAGLPMSQRRRGEILQERGDPVGAPVAALMAAPVRAGVCEQLVLVLGGDCGVHRGVHCFLLGWPDKASFRVRAGGPHREGALDPGPISLRFDLGPRIRGSRTLLGLNSP